MNLPLHKLGIKWTSTQFAPKSCQIFLLIIVKTAADFSKRSLILTYIRAPNCAKIKAIKWQIINTDNHLLNDALPPLHSTKKHFLLFIFAPFFKWKRKTNENKHFKILKSMSSCSSLNTLSVRYRWSHAIKIRNFSNLSLTIKLVSDDKNFLVRYRTR
jgi:hypothetical protein